MRTIFASTSAKRLATTTAAAAFVVIARPVSAAAAAASFVATTTTTRQEVLQRRRQQPFVRNMMSSSSSSSSSTPPGESTNIRHINKIEMQSIVDEYESLGRDGSNCIVIDVRRPDEVQHTGKVSPSTHTLPVEVIMQLNVFSLDDDEFEDVCGFNKPQLDETIVFSCAAGIRSVYACQFASQAGYSNLINYVGGANEWFY